MAHRTVLTPRDLAAMSWVGEMGVADLGQVGTLLCRDTEPVTMARVRAITTRWVAGGYAERGRVFAAGPGLVWLTAAGHRLVGAPGRPGGPPLTLLRHSLLVNDVRLALEARHRDLQWVSERQLLARACEDGVGKRTSGHHVADAEVVAGDGNVTAIEVERVTKSARRYDQILRELTTRYRYLVQYVAIEESTRVAVERAVRTLPPEQAVRVNVRLLPQLTVPRLATGR